MPELPEIETVRRGLQPVMEGSKIVKAEARRKDLRFPFQKDFVARLEGQTVTGLGRRAKYLMADLASGDVLLMHLGMSGSFRVVANDETSAPGKFHHPRGDDRGHHHVVFHISSGASVVFNDPRRFGCMKIIARRALEEEPLLKGLGPEPLGNEFDPQHAGARLRRQEDQPEGRPARPARGRGPRQHLCLRGAVSFAAVAAKVGRDAGDQKTRADRSRQAPGQRHSRRAQPGHQGRRLVAARSSPDLGRTRLFPAFISGLPTEKDETCRTTRNAAVASSGSPRTGHSTFWCPEIPEEIIRSRQPFRRDGWS